MHPLAEIQGILESARFSVLATQDRGQPHASLVAITPSHDSRSILFATYRATRKYDNLSRSDRVALFIGDRTANHSEPQSRSVLTAYGTASEVAATQRALLGRTHAKRHPSLVRLLGSSDCALVVVSVTAYEIVEGIDRVRWYELTDVAPRECRAPPLQDPNC